MEPAREQRVAEALRWLRSVLEGRGTPYQVAGGLAARAHGATRDLHDIDVYLPGGCLDPVARDLAPQRVDGPLRHVGEHWDCYFMKVRYAGEQIELADAERTRYRSGVAGSWNDAVVPFHRSEWRSVFGVRIPVMPCPELLRYKREIGRPVDREDVRELEERRG